MANPSVTLGMAGTLILAAEMVQTSTISPLKAVCEIEEKPPIVIIDELERFEDGRNRSLMADFIKRVADDGIGIKFIICGIASSLSNLIGDHPSSERSFSPIDLKELRYDNLQEIIFAAADGFGIKVSKGIAQRISLISDGFPYFTQLIGEQLFWAMFEDSNFISACNQSHFQIAIDRSVEEAMFTLREKYDKATLKYKNSDDFKYALWSMVMSPTLSQQMSELYNKNYLSIAKWTNSPNVLTQSEFNSRVWYLTQESHGEILKANGAGWYEFSEKMMRGYVRLKAQEYGIEFDPDIHRSDIEK